MNCPSCNTVLTGNSKFCPECGEKLEQEKHCTRCGEKLIHSFKFCPECGEKVIEDGSFDTAVTGPLSYCHASGTAIQPNDRHFRCSYCGELFLEQYRFEETPVCQQCAREQGMAQALEQERAAKAEAEAAQAREAAAREAERQHHEEEARRAREAEERSAREAEASRRQVLEKLGITDEHWVPIQCGRFLMGSPETEGERKDSERQHWVKVDEFEMMKTPVTWAMYLAYCEATSRELPTEPEWGRPKDHPVVNVSYWDAVDYAQWLSEQTGWLCRLPTEAEWEYACRAGTTTPFWTGETISTDQANYDGNYAYGSGCKGVYNKRTTPADLYPANTWRLHDMHGNVSEWCASVFDEHYGGKESDDASQDRTNNRLRVLRGGSWTSKPVRARSAARTRFDPFERTYSWGFRLARIKL